mmetsp:Transcript_1186/g.2668  ORF Transcript_1186/g.2668 Transcript_1186/m.2668 type:complete len:206 (-) Transcript_1186:26-643(-)
MIYERARSTRASSRWTPKRCAVLIGEASAAASAARRGRRPEGPWRRSVRRSGAAAIHWSRRWTRRRRFHQKASPRTRFTSRRPSPTTTTAARSRTAGAWAAGGGRARRWVLLMKSRGTSAGRATTGAGRTGRRSARRGTWVSRTSRCTRRRGRPLPNPSPRSRPRSIGGRRSSRPRSRSWSLGRSGRRVRHQWTWRSSRRASGFD